MSEGNLANVSFQIKTAIQAFVKKCTFIFNQLNSTTFKSLNLQDNWLNICSVKWLDNSIFSGEI